MFHQLEDLPIPQQKKLDLLRENLKSFQRVCVAYSGGVDSSLVAAIAYEQLGGQALAITGISSAVARHLQTEAHQQAQWIGIRHQECFTNEIQDPSYNQNPRNRCFTCKQELHLQLKKIIQSAQDCQVVDGVNHDDLNDYRPGIEAAHQAGVRSPLAELGIDKASVRAISRALGFPWWNKPAQPCLASRFPYGESISSKKLEQVEKAEDLLRAYGFEEIRVRTQDYAAKIELPPHRIEEFIINVGREKIVDQFLSLGFTSVSIDLEGFVSGKMNRVTSK